MTILEKQPSPELLSLIKAAAQSLLGFGELWGAIKAKGADEGFKETDLQDMLRPLLRDRLGMSKDKIYYLFHQEQERERARTNRYIPKILEKKEPEQSQSDALVQEEDFEKWQKEKDNLPVKDSTQFYKEQEEEPTELELANIKIAQLEDALHKTEQFKPATALEAVQQNFDVFEDENVVFDWLRKRDNGINIYYFDNYGRELFANRILSQLKNSGVKTFRRLYFEV